MKLEDIRKQLRSATSAKPKADLRKEPSKRKHKCEQCGVNFSLNGRCVDVMADRWVCETCDAQDICDWFECTEDADFQDTEGKLCAKHHLEQMTPGPARLCASCGGSGCWVCT